MLLDNQSIYSDAQAITGDAASTNSIDHGLASVPKHAAAAVHRDQGKGNKTKLFVGVVEAFNNLTTLTISLQVDNDSAFGSPKTVASWVIPLAQLTAGARLPIEQYPVGTDERYSRLFYDVTGTNPSTGKITAGVVYEAGGEEWPN